MDLSTGEEVVPTKKTVPAQNGKHVDILIAETIPSLVETKVLAGLFSDLAAVFHDHASSDEQVLGENDKIPCIISWTLSSADTVGESASLRACVEACNEDTLKRKPFAVGINCSKPKYVLEAVANIRKAGWKGEIAVYPNSGEVWDCRPGHRGWVRDDEWCCSEVDVVEEGTG